MVSKLTQRILDIISEADSEPDTRAEVDLDDIAGTDKSQQIQTPPQQQQPSGQQQQPAPQKDAPVPPNLDKKEKHISPEEMEKDDNILSSLKGHDYIQMYNGQGGGQTDPAKIVEMDKTTLVALKAKVDDLITTQELRKKIGLYKDNKYQVLLSLKSFIEDTLLKK